MDRGPDSRGVIQLLIDGIDAGRDWTVLRGNHDQMFLDFLDEAEAGGAALGHGDRWFEERVGGRETLSSYGFDTLPAPGDWAKVARAVPEAHRAFVVSLPHCHETEAQFFVHAGIRPGVAFDAQDTQDLIWIREPFLSDTREHGKLVVHGHTALEHP